MSGLVLAGCTLPPSISVLGSYFPDWLFCAVAGLLLTVVVRSLLDRHGRLRALGPPVLVLPAFMLLFSLLAWLLFF
jgi:hypothetical protein